MAKRERITVAPGVTREDWTWSYFFEGKKDDLLRAGLAKESWFADGKARTKRGYIVRSINTEQDGRRVKCTYQVKSRRYRVQIWRSEEDGQRENRRAELERANERGREKIAALCKSHDEFRELTMHIAESYVRALLTLVAGGHDGYSYSREDLEKVTDAGAELVSALRDGRTVFSAEQRQKAIHRIKAETAAADPDSADFERFMQRIAGTQAAA